jgi:hypothetical protein
MDATKKQWLPQIVTPAIIKDFVKILKNSYSVTFPEFLNLIFWYKLFDT